MNTELSGGGQNYCGPLKRPCFQRRLEQVLGAYEPQVQNALLNKLREDDIFYNLIRNNDEFCVVGKLASAAGVHSLGRVKAAAAVNSSGSG